MEPRWQTVLWPILVMMSCRQLKRAGFADRRLGTVEYRPACGMRAQRTELAIHPVYKRVDTCAGNSLTQTAYMYSTLRGKNANLRLPREENHGAGGRTEPYRAGN